MNSSDTKIHIYYGPRKAFDKLIRDKEEIEFFTPLVQEYDKENKKVPLILQGYKPSTETNDEEKTNRHIRNLIIYSDEYSTITEGAVQNFSAILKFFEIEEIFLQNPPLLVVNALKKSYGDVELKNYNYKKISAKNIKL